MTKENHAVPDWDRFHRWERKYEIEKLRKMDPVEKIKILDDLYITVLKIKQSLNKTDKK